MNNGIENIKKFYKKFNPKKSDESQLCGWKDEASARKRYNIFNRLIDLKHKSIVEVGCGYGGLFKFASHFYLELISYLGIDIRKEAIDYNNQHYTTITSITFKCQSLKEYLAKNKKQYDIMIMSGVLSHSDDIEEFTGVSKIIDTFIKILNKHKILCINFPPDFSDVREPGLTYLSAQSIISLLTYNKINYIYVRNFHEDDSLILSANKLLIE
jgi:SAM-dependent methyltransferase